MDLKETPGKANVRSPTPQDIKILVQKLEDLLTEEETCVYQLARLATGVVLEYIFHLEMLLIIRRGPGRKGEHSFLPRRLILAAREAANHDIVSKGTPEDLRRGLLELGSHLKKTGTWESATPLWWEPLPAWETHDDRKKEKNLFESAFGAFPPLPRLNLTDVILPVAVPPLPENRILFHEIDGRKPGFTPIDKARSNSLRIGIVSTVYRAGSSLEAWCEYHFSLGVDYIVLIFDHLEMEEETILAEHLKNLYSSSRLAVWSGLELAQAGWPLSPKDWRLNDLVPYALTGGGSCAVAARQALNATEALYAAKTETLGGAPLDWLIHLDDDEYFFLEGNGRGGASVHEHFSAASSLDLALVRYVNHEWLENSRKGCPRFKINPTLAREKLGASGWARMVHYLGMEQTGPRPYFLGYYNGKSAVDVRYGFGAAGVHGWYLMKKSLPQTLLAGPSILHFQFGGVENFLRRIWSEVKSQPLAGKPLFRISPIVEKGVNLVQSLQEEGMSVAETDRRLTEMYRKATTFEKEERMFLAEAGLVMEPDLKTAPSTDHEQRLD